MNYGDNMNKIRDIIFSFLRINNIILLIIVILCMWIGYNQTKISTNNKIKDNVSLIASIISKEDVPPETVKYVIKNNGIFLDTMELPTSEEILGEGIIFYDTDGITVLVDYKGRCAIKFNHSGDIYVNYEKCAKFDLVMGIKFYVSEKGYGIYREDDGYVYRGPGLDNNLIYGEVNYRIASFNETSITIVEAIGDNTSNVIGEEDLNQILTLNKKVISGDGSLGNPYRVFEN